ncbi:hypothetical protein AcW1_007550 [Taiwanofungus camphoratus]|nr:hypothetical protein AcW2_007394 [Antrodia cinnamomea]KAI0947291.1 hypothetical protein AcV7_009750 [Antrodia cinnamomea]KAI0953296.1 hypothetical protein AcW1_007550 [Antrodia cinnamomea]
MASAFQRGVLVAPLAREGEHDKKFHEAVGILEEGYLVQWTGINPENGEPWKPSWVSKSDCTLDLIAKWEAEKARRESRLPKQGEPATAVLSELHTLKRSSTSSSVPDNWKAVKQETIVEPVTKEEEDVRYKKLKVDSSDYAENVVGISQPMIRQSKTSSQNRKFNTGDRRTRQLNGSSLFIPRNKQGGVRAKRTQNWTQEGLAPGSSLIAHPSNPVDVGGERFESGTTYNMHSNTNHNLQEASESVQDPVPDAEWLLDPAISSKTGMVVVIKGSFGGAYDGGWHSGQYEGAQGVVLSVFETGNSSFASTARVRLFDPIDPAQAVFTIPTMYLWPVGPDQPGQNALILYGNQKGEVAKIREEDPVGWFVSVRHLHFEVASEQLVRVENFGDDGNII